MDHLLQMRISRNLNFYFFFFIYIMKKRNKTKRNRMKTKRNRMKIGGGHYCEEFEHYHLLIKKPTGSVKEIDALFKDDHPEFGIKAGTIGDVREIVKDNERITNFKLVWNGRELDNDDEKIRDIEVNGEKFKLYTPDNTPIDIILLPKEL